MLGERLCFGVSHAKPIANVDGNRMVFFLIKFNLCIGWWKLTCEWKTLNWTVLSVCALLLNLTQFQDRWQSTIIMGRLSVFDHLHQPIDQPKSTSYTLFYVICELGLLEHYNNSHWICGFTASQTKNNKT